MTGRIITFKIRELENCYWSLKILYNILIREGCCIKTSRCVITLCFNERIETSDGVWKTNLRQFDVQAEREIIQQFRRDNARRDGYVLTERFKIRDFFITQDLDYIIFENNMYKILTIQTGVDNHYATIETGQLI